jgi:hypothetical protein
MISSTKAVRYTVTEKPELKKSAKEIHSQMRIL